MNVSSPHYLLFPDVDGDGGNGRWRFVLRAVDGSSHLEAEDIESDTGCERLELLSIVRGLEALDQPSRVTLITTSNYVREGIRRGVIEWRENGWRWERFGQMVPVRTRIFGSEWIVRCDFTRSTAAFYGSTLLIRGRFPIARRVVRALREDVSTPGRVSSGAQPRRIVRGLLRFLPMLWRRFLVYSRRGTD